MAWQHPGNIMAVACIMTISLYAHANILAISWQLIGVKLQYHGNAMAMALTDSPTPLADQMDGWFPHGGGING